MDELQLTQRIIGCAIEVHHQLGPGLLESPYHAALAIEFAHAQLRSEHQRSFPIEYRGVKIGDFIPDFIIEDQIVIEVKCALKYEQVFTAQILTYLRVTRLEVGLILNFSRALMKDGIHRFTLYKKNEEQEPTAATQDWPS